MSEPKLTKLWVNEVRDGGESRMELRADFDNDRHVAAMVCPPHRPRDIAYALMEMARIIANDPVLNRRTAPGEGDGR